MIAVFLLAVCTERGDYKSKEQKPAENTIISRPQPVSPRGTPTGFWQGPQGGLEAGTRVSVDEVARLTGHSGSVRSVAFSPCGTRIASESDDKTVRLWDVATGRELVKLTGHTSGVRSAAFSPDGTRFAHCGDAGIVVVLDVATGRELVKLTGHTDRVRSAAFSPDGTRIASGSDDKSVRVWDSVTGNELVQLTGHTDKVLFVAFNQDGTQINSSSDDKTYRKWDAASGKELSQRERQVHSVSSLMARLIPFDATPDGEVIESDRAYDNVLVWRKTYIWGEKQTASLSGHTGSVGCAAFSPDRTRIVSGSDDKTIRIWLLKK